MVQSWTNADGITQIFGPDKAVAKKGGEYVTVGAMREVEFVITLSALDQTEAVQDNTVFIPAGVRIHELEIITETAAATGTAIDLGLIKTDRTTEIDYDGLLAAYPLAHMDLAGEHGTIVRSVTVPTGLTGTGALVGTTTAFKGYVTCSRTDATAFTAGKIRVKLRFYKP